MRAVGFTAHPMVSITDLCSVGIVFESSTETGIKVYVKVELPAVDGALLEGTKQDGTLAQLPRHCITSIMACDTETQKDKRAATDDSPGSRAPKKQKKAAEQSSKEKDSGNEQRSRYKHSITIKLPDFPGCMSPAEKSAAMTYLFEILATPNPPE